MQKIKYGSVCSGIEAASVAWEQYGWEASWFSEIDAFPSAVLAHHWPHVSNLGDMTRIRDRILSDDVEAPDILVGGTPCQAFSVAGARKSLDDDRGQLTLEYVRLANAIDEKRKEPCISMHGWVRRLTPIECERLQGFPDNHTQIPYRNKSAEKCPDGPRYAACGNSMAVPVMAWIGNRINEILKNESI